MSVRPLMSLLLCTALAGCGSSQDSTSLFQDVGMSFEPCNDAEISNKNRKYDIMPALRVCGSNNVANFAWNPSGTHLYFDLTLTGNVLDASQQHKPLQSLPIDQPTGHPAWLNDQRIAVPIVPDHKDETGRERIALYDIRAMILEFMPVPGLSGISDLQRSTDSNMVLFTALGKDGTRGVYRFTLSDGTLEQPFAWLKGPVDSMTYAPGPRLLTVARGDQVTLYNETGDALGTFSGKRGSVDPTGSWLALEQDGEEVSVFYQRSWEGMSQREREIAERRAERLGERFPEWYPKTVRLPTLEFVHLPTGKRGASTSFYGTRFQWYEREPYWGSFLLWGYEGKQLNTNVQLASLRLRLGAIQNGSDAVGDIKLLPDIDPIQGTVSQPLPAGEPPEPPTEGSEAPEARIE